MYLIGSTAVTVNFFNGRLGCKRPLNRLLCERDRGFEGIAPFLCIRSKNGCGTYDVSPVPSKLAASVGPISAVWAESEIFYRQFLIAFGQVVCEEIEARRCL
jgi:hypothetical protein